MLRRSPVPNEAIPLPSTGAIDPLAPDIGLPAYPSGAASYASTSTVPTSAGPSAATLQALKDELFELETDRIKGRITAEEYAEHKAAFDVVLRRALSRIEAVASASNV